MKKLQYILTFSTILCSINGVSAASEQKVIKDGVYTLKANPSYSWRNDPKFVRRNISFWSTVAKTSFKDTFNLSGTSGGTKTFTFGIGYQPINKLEVGLFYGYAATDAHTKLFTGGQQDTISNSINAYVNYDFVQWLSGSVLGGYSGTDTAITNKTAPDPFGGPGPFPITGSTIPGRGLLFRASLDAHAVYNNFFGSINLGYTHNRAISILTTNTPLTLNPNIGVGIINQDILPGNATSKHNLNLLATIGHSFFLQDDVIYAVSPYIKGGVDFDLKKQTIRTAVSTPNNTFNFVSNSRARVGLTLGTGFRLMLPSNITAGFDYTNTSGHSGFRSDTYSINAKIRF